MSGIRIDCLIFILALLACARFAFPLLEPEESRYAELPRQMLETGSWIVPTLDGQPYLDKPPLLYWLIASSYQLFGVSVPVARIVPSLVAALTIWVIYRWGQAVAGIGVGIVSAAILITMPDFLYRAPMLTMNGLLAALTTAALATGFLAISPERFRWRWWFISAICCGIGVLTKGPIAVALVIGPLVVCPWLDRRLRKPSVLAFAAYGGIVVAVAGPWFAAVAVRESGFLEYFFWKHHVERVVNPFDHSKPWWFYLPQVLLGTLPWAPILFAATVAWLRRRPVPTLVPFGLIAGVIGLTLFSISGSKRPVYLVPIYPPLAIAAGAYLWAIVSSPNGRLFGFAKSGWTRSLVIISAAFISASFAFLPEYHRRFSAGPVLEIANTSDRVYAVPYSSPAASFAMRRIVPWLPLERLNEIAPPAAGERVIVFVPLRYADKVRELLNGSGWMAVENGEVVAFIRDGDR